jgi:hypothetical protein
MPPQTWNGIFNTKHQDETGLMIFFILQIQLHELPLRMALDLDLFLFETNQL